ncbi:MAG TPA: 50S ribosomal protein L18 [Methanoregulaceae archaeon]|nr:MAG: 50S ribosomal protein L18 [Methanolinea sp.]HON81623.1 50S ribosomal protein L18 [Methanoregulaceae archaeon]HPD10430.1 50S ribosomal protein L18 [Methanoregulaceae archaeon]HRT15372.1 50S ribosomal protein L18 [Methanoregulaceae archaeon]HRU31022.1 50S ribosomal protein L18 [Methanoregulaceae archaeon]
MATAARYFVPFRRRKEGRTDYYRRAKLVVSDRPRMVVRKTNRHIIIQMVSASLEGDHTLVTASSADLARFGYRGSMSNTPAAYLTGILFAVRALNADHQSAVLDIGLHRATPGSRVFAALKGAVTAGLDIPHGEAVLPDESRVKGAHIAAYAPDRAGNLVQNVEETFDAIMKELR